MNRFIKFINLLLLAFVFGSLLYLYFKHGPQAVVDISMPSILVSFILLVFSFVEITRSARRTYEVNAAPGAVFMKMVRFFYSEKTIVEVFEPTQRDFLDEYADAISDYVLADHWTIRSSAGMWVFRVRCKYYFAFFRAVLKQNHIAVFFQRVLLLLAGK